MRFKAKKVYGNYKKLNCPFCDRTATQKNGQGLDVCHLHTKEMLPEFKCTCGSWVEVRSSKYGPYFKCENCGNLNYKRGMEIKALTAGKEDKSTSIEDNSIEKRTFATEPRAERRIEKSAPKEITITSHDAEYFD